MAWLRNHWFEVLSIALLIAIYVEARDINDTADQARRHAIAAEEKCTH